MLLLETHNRILYDEVISHFEGDRRVNNIFADFDGVKFNVQTSDDKSSLMVSVSLHAAADLLKNGGSALLKSVYGDMLQAKPEPGYDVTLVVPSSYSGNKEELAKKISLLKRHLVAAPFLMVFEGIEAKKPLPEIIAINYRTDETFYLKPQGDNVIVIFDIAFKDADDVVLSKIFLQSFVDVRKTISNVPSITFSQKDPPLELKGVKGVRAGQANHGFVSFVLFPAHIKKPQESADLIQTFRDYLHYHIKCAKGYMHTSMRNRVESLIQVLNRAKPEPVNTVKRTITGKFFKQN
ncbi:hypothetical protein RB653_006501 [Dictyostelium firmibasis]|uniref:Arp2/3 complex 34 kDa subunit n=1 Tax=Dictyostelium firmibasis TaxID=79012 RepID=A0AAN7UMS0_9MYCE